MDVRAFSSIVRTRFRRVAAGRTLAENLDHILPTDRLDSFSPASGPIRAIGGVVGFRGMQAAVTSVTIMGPRACVDCEEVSFEVMKNRDGIREVPGSDPAAPVDPFVTATCETQHHAYH